LRYAYGITKADLSSRFSILISIQLGPVESYNASKLHVHSYM